MNSPAATLPGWQAIARQWAEGLDRRVRAAVLRTTSRNIEVLLLQVWLTAQQRRWYHALRRAGSPRTARLRKKQRQSRERAAKMLPQVRFA